MVIEPSAAALSDLFLVPSEYRWSGLGSKKYCALYIVSDQKPLTGGN